MTFNPFKKQSVFVVIFCLLALVASSLQGQDASEPVDFNRAKEIMQKQRQGEQVTPAEKQYLERARAEYQRQHPQQQGKPGTPQEQLVGKPSTGLKPLPEMSASDKYKGEDGGLYGGGKNDPPESLKAAAQKELAQIRPLGSDGKPSPDGRVVLISIGMSNTTMEFSRFKQIADADPQKSPTLTIVDCAQGGQTAQIWAGGSGRPGQPASSPWKVAEQRLTQAGVTPQQVQVVWIKEANAGPQGELSEHAKKLQQDMVGLLQLAKQHFPNLRIAYLSSRIYAGYATTHLNPEPYAYEGAFAMRWLILDQIANKPELNHDPARGEVKAPLLLWGPYLWGDGMTPRKSDGLIWERNDLAGDGTHPSSTSGMQKVADMLLQFFKTNPNAKPWFLKAGH